MAMMKSMMKSAMKMSMKMKKSMMVKKMAMKKAMKKTAATCVFIFLILSDTTSPFLTKVNCSNFDITVASLERRRAIARVTKI